MISINEVKNGMALLVDNDINIIVDFQHVKPGKGSAFVRIKLKNMKNGRVVERTYRSSDRLEDIFIETRKLQFLYASGDEYHFMDQNNYEQLVVNKDIIGDGIKYLKENMDVMIALHEHVPLSVTLPVAVELKVVMSEPGLKGDTAKGGSKIVELETGAKIQVPLFINQGDVLKIDTRTGQYVERVSTK